MYKLSGSGVDLVSPFLGLNLHTSTLANLSPYVHAHCHLYQNTAYCVYLDGYSQKVERRTLDISGPQWSPFWLIPNVHKCKLFVCFIFTFWWSNVGAIALQIGKEEEVVKCWW